MGAILPEGGTPQECTTYGTPESSVHDVRIGTPTSHGFYTYAVQLTGNIKSVSFCRTEEVLYLKTMMTSCRYAPVGDGGVWTMLGYAASMLEWEMVAYGLDGLLKRFVLYSGRLRDIAQA